MEWLRELHWHAKEMGVYLALKVWAIFIALCVATILTLALT